MRALQASSLGYKTREVTLDDGNGVVHSVFDRVVNFELYTDLYSIVSTDVPETPYTLKLGESNLNRLEIREDQIVDIQYKKIQIGANEIRIPDTTPVWRQRTQKNSLIPKINLSTLSKSIAKHGKEGGMKPLLNLFESTPRLNDNHFSETARKPIRKTLENEGKMYLDPLIGLGPGLTPSGDDLLSGLLATLFLMKSKISDRIHQELTPKILGKAKKKTNTISYQFLRNYSMGMIDENLDSLYINLQDDSINCLDKAVEKVCTIGHSSGTDLAIGVLTALRIMEEKN
jgi:hypothetical protein